MIRFGLRLTMTGGRDAIVRLVVIAVAVAVGSALLLSSLAGINAVDHQNGRYAWLATSVTSGAAQPGEPATDPLWGMLRTDAYASHFIFRADVAATGPRSPAPPGLTSLPGPDQYYASPALARLISDVPDTQLADRFGGHLVGIIGHAGLPSPDSLIAIVGHPVGDIKGRPGAAEVWRFNTASPDQCGDCSPGIGVNSRGIDLILSVVAAALLFPVLIFIISATRLSAARREQRFAAMRLVGATPRQISTISAVESTVATAIGVAAGFGLFFVLRPSVAAIPFTGDPFFTADLSLNPADVLLVAIGLPVAAAIAARFALRRIQISPLGVTRRATPRQPSPWRLMPLVAGVAELSIFLVIPHPHTGAGQVRAYLSGILLIMAGLVIAGPWLTGVGSRVMLRRTRRPAMLIAARRLADNPQAGFRAISGLTLALFVTTVAVSVITTFVANRGTPSLSQAAATTIVKDFANDASINRDTSSGSVPSVPAWVVPALDATPGVTGVTLIRTAAGTAPHSAPNRRTVTRLPGGETTRAPGLVSCADLAHTPAYGHCAAGAVTATIGGDFYPGRPGKLPVWAAADVSIGVLETLPVQVIAIATDGSTAAIERARTVLEQALPLVTPPATVDELDAISNKQIGQYQQLANVVILVTLPIAGCSLAVALAAGLTERKRPFSLLRLAGAPLALLRRVVAWESVVPLLVAAIVAIGMGFAAAQLFLSSQLGYTLRPPGPAFYVAVAIGLLLSLAVIASTLPLLERMTGPEVARND